MPPSRSTKCPRCGFSYAWNGRKCGHCPSPSRARLLWEQIGRFSELVGSDKGITQRQLLMIAAGCLHRVVELLPEPAREAVDQLERDPKGVAAEWGQEEIQPLRSDNPELLTVHSLRIAARSIALTGHLDVQTVQTVAVYCCQAIISRPFPDRELLAYSLPEHLERFRSTVETRLTRTRQVAPTGQRQRRSTHFVEAAIDHLRQARRQAADVAEQAAQCEIARDVLGYPEVTVSFDPNWSTSTAVAMVQSMYEHRDFSAMPILADALQDAGCDEPEILEHCRGYKPHVRGCWVCEAILSVR